MSDLGNAAGAGDSAASTTRVAIVEDDPTIRRYLLQALMAKPGIDVIGLAPDMRAARGLIALEPDLFLLDIGLPDGNGYDLIPAIKKNGTAKVLIISAFGDRETVLNAMQAGADGYLLKDSAPEILIDGIAVTLAGGAPISPAAAVFMLERLRSFEEDSFSSNNAPSEDRLTAREVDLLQQFCAGKSYKEAARALDISPHTVGNHVKSIYRKLEVNSRSEAIREAQRGGELRHRGS